MLDNGVERTFTFAALGPAKILGITFETGVLPIVVQSFPPGSKAEAAGMRIGMLLKKIDGVGVDGKTYAQIMDMVKDALRKLPCVPVLHQEDAAPGMRQPSANQETSIASAPIRKL